MSVRPTRRALAAWGGAAVLAFAPAIAGPRFWPAWAVAAGGLLALFVFDALRLPRARSFRCSVEAPLRLHPGRPAAALASVALAADEPLAVELALDPSGTLGPVARSAGVLAGGRGVLPLTLQPERRGMARLDGAWLRYAGPLGLAGATARVPLTFTRPVVPDLQPVERDAIRFFRERDLRAGLKIERYRGEGTEFDALRAFAVGDDPRAVHWKASARHGSLLVRQYRAERNHQVVLVFDTGRLSGERIGPMSRLDHALEAGLLLAFVALASGDRVGTFTFGARVGPALDPAAGVATFPRLVNWSAGVDDRPEETNFTLGLTTLATRLRRRSLAIVLTDFVDTVSAELMVDNVARLAARHVVIFVALRDPSLGALAAARPEDTLTLHRAAVAEGIAREREAVLLRLGRLGVTTIDAVPGAVGPELVNRYLEIRRRERI